MQEAMLIGLQVTASWMHQARLQLTEGTRKGDTNLGKIEDRNPGIVETILAQVSYNEQGMETS